jgi:hypothetical protein
VLACHEKRGSYTQKSSAILGTIATPKHGHAPRKELIGGGTYLEVREEVP